MLMKRDADKRGMFNHGWLDTRHSFSFAEYYDPEFMGFRQLRVINEDRVAAGAGFPPHPHQDMEIISYIVSGGLEHRDSMGTGSVVRGGEVQRMTAGTGVLHSEFNTSDQEPVHFLQIWIVPEKRGLEPGYEQQLLGLSTQPDQWIPVASGNGNGGGMKIHQDVGIRAARLSAGGEIDHPLAPGRHAWIQVVEGEISVNGVSMAAGDGMGASDEPGLSLVASSDAEVLLFDLA